MNARTLPLFPLGTLLFPGGPLSLRVFERRYLDMVGRCLREGTGFGVVLLIRGREAGADSIATAAVGTEAEIVDFDRLEDGLLGLTCRGRERFRILRAWRADDGLNLAEVEDLAPDPGVGIPEDCAHLVEALRRLEPELPEPYRHVERRWDDAAWVGNRIVELAPLEPDVKQGLLELTQPLERLRVLAPLVQLRDA